MDHFGLDRKGVAALRDDLVYVRMPAFGLDNPWRERVAFQMTIEPIAGLAAVTGSADGPPLTVGICDALGGAHAAFGMLCGLRHRDHTGVGVHVEVRLSEVAAAIAAEPVVAASAHGVVLSRVGNRQWWGGPQGVYACRGTKGEDPEWVAVSVDTDEQWLRARSVLDDAAWVSDPTLGTVTGRVAAADGLDARLGAWCATRTAAAVVQELLCAGVPAARECRGVEVLDHEQLAAREFSTECVHPVCGTLRYPSLPVTATRLRDAGPLPTHHTSPAPMRAEHDELVLTRLGIDPADARRLRRARVIGRD
jgi:crotonobetainyl-CoA:carnitine CoA-transferase CaiB-like acyl-CoA transferase